MVLVNHKYGKTAESNNKQLCKSITNMQTVTCLGLANWPPQRPDAWLWQL